MGDSRFTLTVPVEEVVANLDDGALVKMALDLSVISPSVAEEIILAREGLDKAARDSGQAADNSVLGFSFGQPS